MPEKTKQKKDSQKPEEKKIDKPPAEEIENENATWGRDQREKSYYYDDAHGYEIYNPDEDVED